MSLQPLTQRRQEHEKKRKEIKELWQRAKRKLVRPAHRGLLYTVCVCVCACVCVCVCVSAPCSISKGVISSGGESGHLAVGR